MRSETFLGLLNLKSYIEEKIDNHPTSLKMCVQKEKNEPLVTEKLETGDFY